MATAKKTPPKKTAAKAPIPPAKNPRSDYKPGVRVKVTLADDSIVTGRVVSVRQTATGPFIVCTIPTTHEFRPAKVKGYR